MGKEINLNPPNSQKLTKCAPCHRMLKVGMGSKANLVNKGLLSTKVLSLITRAWERTPEKHQRAVAWPLYSLLGTCYSI